VKPYSTQGGQSLQSIRETYEQVENDMARSRVDKQKNELMSALGYPIDNVVKEIQNLEQMLKGKLNMSGFSKAVAAAATGSARQKAEVQRMFKEKQSDQNVLRQFRDAGLEKEFRTAVNQSPEKFADFLKTYSDKTKKPEAETAAPAGAGGITLSGTTLSGITTVLPSGQDTAEVSEIVSHLSRSSATDTQLTAALRGTTAVRKAIADQAKTDSKDAAIKARYEAIKKTLDAKKIKTDQENQDLKYLDEIIPLL
jgi:hypothetical protein